MHTSCEQKKSTVHFLPYRLAKTAFIILAVSKCTYDKGLSHCSLRTEVTNFVSEKVEQITHTYQPK